MKATDVGNPEYFHKVVDCQYACPAHTPVPEYIRLIAMERYTDAYMINWESNVFPGVLGRTCNRPCDVAASVDHADPVNKVSIIPRGIAALGYTQQLPTEDRYLMTKEELLDRLAVLLGGRVAEETVFADVSTGAQNDLQRATDIARSMVTEYGMSEKLGLATYARERQALFLPTGSPPPRAEYSEETARVIDEEIAGLIESTHVRVREILTDRREDLEALATVLLDKETITGKEMEELFEGVKGPE